MTGSHAASAGLVGSAVEDGVAANDLLPPAHRDDDGRPPNTPHDEVEESLLEALLLEEPDEQYCYGGSEEPSGVLDNDDDHDDAGVYSSDHHQPETALSFAEDESLLDAGRLVAEANDSTPPRSISSSIVWESGPSPGSGGGSEVWSDDFGSISLGDDDAGEHDSLLRAAALVPLQSNNNGGAEPAQTTTTRRTIGGSCCSCSSSALTARERLALLIALACALIVLPTMLLPELLRKETRFPRCRLSEPEQHCGDDDDATATASCVPDGLSKTLICCPDDLVTTTTFLDDDVNGPLRPVCGKLPTKTRCGRIDELCASGYCIGGTCASRALRRFAPCDRDQHCEYPLSCQKRAYTDSETVCCAGSTTGGSVCQDMPVGNPCATIYHCESRLCIFGTCASSKLPDSEQCEKDDDCQSGSCAGDAVGSSNKICCREAFPAAAEESTSSFSQICGDRPTNTVCGITNEICSSGYCINKSCAGQQLGRGQACAENDDCASGGCALVDAADFTKSPVCCEHSSTVQVYHDNRDYWVCGRRPRGTFCGFENGSNNICLSGICVNDYCADSRLDDMDETCKEDDDCVNGVCSLSSIEQGASSICCPNGLTTTGRLGNETGSRASAAVCAGMPAGTPCGNDDAACESGFCIETTCAVEGLETSQPCQEGGDCKSKTCGLRTANTTEGNVCCETSSAVMGYAVSTSLGVDYRYLCTARPDGTFCNAVNEMCASGLCINGYCAKETLRDLSVCSEGPDCDNLHCALASANSSSSKICCPKGKTTTGYYYNNLEFCGGMPDGTYCGDTSSICASGFCINQFCAPGTEMFAPCAESADCISGAFALGEANATSTALCCNGTATTTGIVWGSLSFQTVCANRPVGTFCNGINEMCLSGLCINGYCVNETLRDLSLCSEGPDCDYLHCALASANSSSSKICCPKGNTTNAGPKGNTTTAEEQGYYYLEFCGGMPDGTYCKDIPSICASGFCINQVCAPGIDNRERCTESLDCTSGKCGRLEAMASSPTVCCESRSVVTGPIFDRNTTSRSTLLCTERPVGTFCNTTDSMCASGLCINGFCVEKALADGELCQDGTDCQNGACGLRSADPKSPRICCRGGASASNWSASTFDTVCSAMPVGTYCRDLDSVCLSGFCVNQTCAKVRLAAFAPCADASDCQTGVCELAFADFSASKVCCPSSLTGLMSNQTGDWHYVCFLMPGGSRCVGNDSCQSGFCHNQTCTEQSAVPSALPSAEPSSATGPWAND
jgi:hypothetical protein